MAQYTAKLDIDTKEFISGLVNIAKKGKEIKGDIEKELSNIAATIDVQSVKKSFSDISNLASKAGAESGDKFSSGYESPAQSGVKAANKKISDQIPESYDNAGEEAGSAFVDGFEDTTGKGISAATAELGKNIKKDYDKVGETAGRGFSDNFAKKTKGGIASALGDIGKFAAGTMLADFATKAVSGIIENIDTIPQAMRQIQIATGATGSELEKLGDISKQAFIGGLGDSLEDAGMKITQLRNILGEELDEDGNIIRFGVADEDLEEFAVKAQKISTAFDKDFNEVVGKSRSFIRAFGLEGQEALDMIGYGLKNTATTQDDFLDTLDEYSNVLASVGFTGEQTMAILKKGIDENLWNTDKLGDSIKELRIRLNAGDFIKPFEDMNNAMGDSISSFALLARNGVANFDDLKEYISAGLITETDAQRIAEDGQLTVAEFYTSVNKAIQEKKETGELSESIAEQFSVALAGTPAEEAADAFNRIIAAAADTTEIEKSISEYSQALNAGMENFSIETFQREVMVMFAEIGQSIYPLINIVSETLSDTLLPAIKGVMQTLVDSGIFDTLAGMIQGLTPVFETLGDIVQSLASPINSILNLIVDLLDPIMQLFEPIGNIIEVLAPILDIIIQQLGGVLTSVLSSLIPVIVELLNTIAGIITALQPIIDITMMLVDMALKPFIMAIEIAAKVLTALLVPVNKIIKQFGDFMKTALEELQPELDELMTIFTEFAAELAPAIVEIMTTLINLYFELRAAIIQIVVQMFGFKDSGEAMRAVISGISLALKAYIAYAKGVISVILGIVNGIKAATDAVGKFFGASNKKGAKPVEDINNALDEQNAKQEKVNKTTQDYSYILEGLSNNQKIQVQELINAGKIEEAIALKQDILAKAKLTRDNEILANAKANADKRKKIEEDLNEYLNNISKEQSDKLAEIETAQQDSERAKLEQLIERLENKDYETYTDQGIQSEYEATILLTQKKIELLEIDKQLEQTAVKGESTEALVDDQEQYLEVLYKVGEETRKITALQKEKVNIETDITLPPDEKLRHITQINEELIAAAEEAANISTGRKRKIREAYLADTNSTLSEYARKEAAIESKYNQKQIDVKKAGAKAANEEMLNEQKEYLEKELMLINDMTKEGIDTRTALRKNLLALDYSDVAQFSESDLQQATTEEIARYEDYLMKLRQIEIDSENEKIDIMQEGAEKRRAAALNDLELQYSQDLAYYIDNEEKKKELAGKYAKDRHKIETEYLREKNPLIDSAYKFKENMEKALTITIDKEKIKQLAIEKEALEENKKDLDRALRNKTISRSEYIEEVQNLEEELKNIELEIADERNKKNLAIEDAKHNALIDAKNSFISLTRDSLGEWAKDNEYIQENFGDMTAGVTEKLDNFSITMGKGADKTKVQFDGLADAAGSGVNVMLSSFQRLTEEGVPALQAFAQSALLGIIDFTEKAVLANIVQIFTLISGLIPPPGGQILAAGIIATGMGMLQVAKAAIGAKTGEIDIRDGTNDTADDVPRLVSRGESIITAKGTRRNKELLKAANKGLDLEEYTLSKHKKEIKYYITDEVSKVFKENITDTIISKSGKLVLSDMAKKDINNNIANLVNDKVSYIRNENRKDINNNIANLVNDKVSYINSFDNRKVIKTNNETISRKIENKIFGDQYKTIPDIATKEIPGAIGKNMLNYIKRQEKRDVSREKTFGKYIERVDKRYDDLIKKLDYFSRQYKSKTSLDIQLGEAKLRGDHLAILQKKSQKKHLQRI